MVSTNPIHIVWSGPIPYDEVVNKHGGSRYGLYQYYGHHPVYGNNTLLYIGKAFHQSFNQRLMQHNLHEWNSGETYLVLGEIATTRKLSEEEWKNQVEQAESLLIYTHSPAWNSSNIASVDHSKLDGVHIYNWERRHSLLPEVSHERWRGFGNRLPSDLTLQSAL